MEKVLFLLTAGNCCKQRGLFKERQRTRTQRFWKGWCFIWYVWGAPTWKEGITLCLSATPHVGVAGLTAACWCASWSRSRSRSSASGRIMHLPTSKPSRSSRSPQLAKPPSYEPSENILRDPLKAVSGRVISLNLWGNSQEKWSRNQGAQNIMRWHGVENSFLFPGLLMRFCRVLIFDNPPGHPRVRSKNFLPIPTMIHWPLGAIFCNSGGWVHATYSLFRRGLPENSTIILLDALALQGFEWPIWEEGVGDFCCTPPGSNHYVKNSEQLL